MLVLTRRIEESVAVGDPDSLEKLIKVTVVSIDGGRVRLGFEAAGDVPILRWEVWQRVREKRRENKRTRCAVAPVV
jgi:carbon storage regulator CsrA